jgi:putative addiction module component (TIGR02574 family)
MADILHLSVEERLRLAEQIWDSIAENPENLPLSEAQRAELDRRLEAYKQSPDAGSSWEEVKERLKGRK